MVMGGIGVIGSGVTPILVVINVVLVGISVVEVVVMGDKGGGRH